ncbi:sensor histidine kinase [Desulfonatronum thioautotrophicum]|uniref:sensor histidine kinase n=1 Tax=Desulfonatronum thioautotrophicum TaxID=617001 RepID=UPI0006995DB1|nr:PAS domain S-box protein [Desulfonatronum thioautotrophicum]
MTVQDAQDQWADNMRSKAEECARKRSSGQGERLEPSTLEEARELIHELRVNKIEVELQNEQLRLIQNELDAQRTRYVKLFDHAPVGYLTLDENGLILEANLTAAGLLGVDRFDLIHQGATRFVSSDDQDDFYLFRRQVLQTSRKQAWEMPLLRHDGTSFWAWLEAVPTSEDRDHTRQILLLINDITRRRQAEEENLRTRSLLETAGRLARFGGWSVDLATNRVHFCGQGAQIHGASPGFSPTVEEAIRFYPPEWREKIAAVFYQCATKGEPFDEEMEIVTLQGEKIWIRTTGQAVSDAAGRIRKVEGAFQDITERKKFEESLQASVAEKDVLLREVHHRVKNNLAVISSLVELQHQSMTDGDKIAQLQDLSNRIKSMALVHECLYHHEDVSKIDFQDYLEALMRELCPALNSRRGISCSVKAQGVTLSLQIAVPCGLIINELVSNALKYAFPDGRTHDGLARPRIQVEMEKGNGTCRLVVADNGVGLPPEIDPQTTNSFGLHIVRMIGTHQLRGELEVERGGGTRFMLNFKASK